MERTLHPTPKRRLTAKKVAACLQVVLGIHAILWPKEPPLHGQAVKRQLFGFLGGLLGQAPQRGRGAYLRRFLEHALKVTRSYAPGLFRCYDDPRIPQTSNLLESRNGGIKRNLRRCAGRSSTASGPGSSYGRFYAFAHFLHACLPAEDIHTLLSHVDLEAYSQARRQLEEVHAPAAKRRAFLRDPEKHLAEILARWRLLNTS